MLEEKKNIYWLDYLRVLATFAVIFLHVSGINLSNTSIFNEYAWHVSNTINSSVRWAVPIFIMISGALLLGKEIALIPFLKKRMRRLAPPFLFWSAIYLLYAFYIEHAFDALPFLERAETFYKMFCERASFHLWYVYFFIGLTLFTPIINRWIIHAPVQEIKYFLIIWFISLFFIQPYIKEWIPQIDLSFFASFIGYYILGYYLYHLKIEFNKKFKPGILICLALLLLFSIYITRYLSLSAGSFIETFNHYTSWNVILSAACIFLLFKELLINNSILNRSVQLISKHSYGIYLSHVFVLTLLNIWLEPFYISQPLTSILLGSIVGFGMSFLLVFVLKQIPFLKKIIG